MTGLLLMFGLFPMAMAGDLLGTVVDEAGEPVEDVLVLAYDQRLSYGSSTTDAEGRFALRGLPKNPYRVRMIPPDGRNVVERYVPNTGQICEADITPLKRNDEVDIGEVALPSGGVALGKLVDSEGAPVVGAEVIARPVGLASGVLNRSGESAEDGSFQVLGIPLLLDGTAWRMEVELTDSPTQFLGAAYDEELAEIWELAPDVPVELGQHALLTGGTLRGDARGPAGALDATVYAFTEGRVRTVEAVDGAWEIAGLVPGEATLWAEAPGHASTWYGDSDRPVLGPIVDDNVILDGLTLTLKTGSHLLGRLDVDDGAGMSITAVNEDGSVAVTTAVSEDGSFDIERLAVGPHSLQIQPRDDQDLLDGTLLDEHALPQLFEVPLSDTVDVGTLSVPLGARIQGVVRDRYTDKPVYGAWVYVEDVDAKITRLVVTEPDGTYVMGGLAVGTYKVWSEYQHYCDGDVDWVVRYYPDQVNPALAGSVALTPGQVLDWAVGMAPDLDHDAMDDDWEQLHRLDPSRDDSAEDPDGDGFTNLEEYLFDTDPMGIAGGQCGCGGGGSAWMLLGLPFAFMRRRLVTHA